MTDDKRLAPATAERWSPVPSEQKKDLKILAFRDARSAQVSAIISNRSVSIRSTNCRAESIESKACSSNARINRSGGID